MKGERTKITCPYCGCVVAVLDQNGCYVEGGEACEDLVAEGDLFNDISFEDKITGIVSLAGKIEERLREMDVGVDEVVKALREAGLGELAEPERIESIAEGGGLWNWVDWFEMFGAAEYMGYDAGGPGASGELFWGFVRDGCIEDVEGKLGRMLEVVEGFRKEIY